MTQHPDHKTLADGSIDYAYYEKRTREIRAQSFHAVLKSLFGALTGILRSRPADNAKAKPSAIAAPKPAVKANPPKLHPTAHIGIGPRDHQTLRHSHPF